MASLQTGCPDKLRLVGCAPGNAQDERNLHERFAKFRVRGEWFTAGPELVEFIHGVCFATRELPPFPEADETTIGGLCVDDLDRIAAYVSLRMLEKRAESMLCVAELPFPLGECMRNEASNVCHELAELQYQEDVEANELLRLADPNDRLRELHDALLKEVKTLDAVRHADCASREKQAYQLHEDSEVH